MSPLWSVPLLHEQRGHDAFVGGHVGFEAGAGGRAVRVGLQFLDLGDEHDRVEQVGDALAGDGAGLDELDVAAHVVGQKPFRL